MNIVEKEIAKRQVIVDSKAEKVAELEELKTRVAELEAEIAEIHTEELEAEIEELKEVLAVVNGEVVEEAVEGEVVEPEVEETVEG